MAVKRNFLPPFLVCTNRTNTVFKSLLPPNTSVRVFFSLFSVKTAVESNASLASDQLMIPVLIAMSSPITNLATIFPNQSFTSYISGLYSKENPPEQCPTLCSSVSTSACAGISVPLNSYIYSSPAPNRISCVFSSIPYLHSKLKRVGYSHMFVSELNSHPPPETCALTA